MAEKINVHVILPDMPYEAPEYMRSWWRDVRFAFEQSLPRIIMAVNDKVDGVNRLVKFDVLSSAPTDIEDGMVIYADGTTYDPGSGRGVYERRSGAWHKL